MIGHVIMHRDIMDWEWYQSPQVSRLYFHLILKANFKEKRWQGQLVKRGQLITSNNHLAAELRLSVQNIRTALSKLKETRYITVNTTNRFTLITVVNYDKFQSAKGVANKQNNTQITDKQQSNNNQSTITKESNKEKKVNKEKIELRREKFKNQVFEHSQYDIKILKGFFEYWSELNGEKNKMRFENQRFFEIDKRLEKWKLNERQNSVSTSNNKTASNR
ncbi:hypothetical protein ACU8DI_01540 [Psychroserpens sp. BH13MA-6]